MPKLILLQGLPASGKSTRAEELLKETGNMVRLNRDLLRKMLHFGKWSRENEKATIFAETALALEFLSKGKSVIIDDTNLSPKVVERWRALAGGGLHKFEILKMDTPYIECLLRDQIREDDRVGDHVITGMALQYGLYPDPKKGFVLCDLDGTLADVTHRLHYVRRPEGEKKDWKAFFEHCMGDTPRMEVVDMVFEFEKQGYDVFIVSARPDTYRHDTEIWLRRAFQWVAGYPYPYKGVIMRRAGDKRPDTETKAEMIATYFPNLKKIHAIIDDRPSVIRMWREKGINVIDVGKGIEF